MISSKKLINVKNIVGDETFEGIHYFKVQWKNTVTTSMHLYVAYKHEMKNVTKINGEYIIQWKETWMQFDELKHCSDELLGTYSLLKLKHYCKKFFFFSLY